MGIFSTFRSRDKPVNRTAGSSFSFYMGGSSSGKSVTERSAMQMTAVYACVRILSEAIAGLPLHLYRYTDNGGKEKAIDHPLYLLMHDEPNPEMSSFVFRETLMTHLLLWGNAYAQIIRNGKGEIVALYPLMPNKMSVDRDEFGHIIYKYSRSDDEAIKSEQSVILTPYDVLHIPGLGFDGLVGYSPIAMSKNAIGMPDDLIAKLTQLGSRTDEVCETALKAGAEVAEKAISSNLSSVVGRNTKHPSQSTGQLEKALGVSPVKVDGKGNYDIKVGFNEPRTNRESNAKIANILEYGKSNQPPKPFLKPAKSKSRKEIINVMKDTLEKEMDNV